MVNCLSLNINMLDFIQTLSSGDDKMVGCFEYFTFLHSASHFSAGSQSNGGIKLFAYLVGACE